MQVVPKGVTGDCRKMADERSSSAMPNSTVSPGGMAENLIVRLVAIPPSFTGPSDFLSVVGPIQYRVPYVEAEDAPRASCFLTLSPAVPDQNLPAVAVNPTASFALRFSEPVDPGLFDPFESVRLLRTLPQGQVQRLGQPLAHHREDPLALVVIYPQG